MLALQAATYCNIMLVSRFIFLGDDFISLSLLERQSDRDISHLQFHSSNGCIGQGCARLKVGVLELYPGVPRGWQKVKYLAYHLLLSHFLRHMRMEHIFFFFFNCKVTDIQRKIVHPLIHSPSGPNSWS